MFNITYFQRKRRPGANHSIEQIFDALALRFSTHYKIHQKVLPFLSLGVLRRLLNMLVAPFYQGDVNHVTGDINYIALSLKKEKTISTFHDLGILHQTSGLKRYILLKVWFQWPIQNSKWVTVVSESTKKDLLQSINCNPKKVKVIYVPIASNFKPNQKKFNSYKPIILQIGSAQNKNLKRLISAVKNISCQLLIIGRISENNLSLLKEARIDFENRIGISQKEVVDCYNRCDLLFFASTFEGFGMPILEAQAVGRPVLTSNILSMPEVGGDAAVYIDPYDVKEIEKALLNLINNPELREAMIQKGFENVKRFNPEVIALQYEALYKDILK